LGVFDGHTDSNASRSQQTASRMDLVGREHATSSEPPPNPPNAPTSGGPEDLSGDDTGGNQPGARRRQWLIGGAAAGLVILAIVGVTLGLHSRGGSPPTPTDRKQSHMSPDSMSFSGTNVRLTRVDKSIEASLLPDVVQSGQCHGVSGLGWDNQSRGAISCTDPHNPDISVTYIKFDTKSHMETHWQAYLALASVFKPGPCGAPGDMEFVENDARFSEGYPSRLNGPLADTGHLLCSQPHGHFTRVWTNNGINVIAQVRASGAATWKQVLNFWAFEAGPFGNG